MRFQASFLGCFAALGLALAACGDDEPAATPALDGSVRLDASSAGGEIEIAGRYDTNFGGMETITSTAWAGVAIRKFDNAQNYAVTQNAPDAMFGPNLFNKLVWTEKTGDTFYYCFVDFSRATLAQAETTTKTADASMPETGGCGGFGWTKMTAR